MLRTLNETQGRGGNRSKWENMIQWARNNLAKEGHIARPADSARGRWKLTEGGLKKSASFKHEASPITYSDEVPETVIEGAKIQVFVNLYERRASA